MRSLFIMPESIIPLMTGRIESVMITPEKGKTKMLRDIKILIVDDQPRTRRSLKALLSTCVRADVIREAAGGMEAVQVVQEAHPDLVLMDVQMPGMDGLQATRLIKASWPSVSIIALSMYNDYRVEALAAGASAFISKGDSPDSLLEAIEKMAAN